MPLGTYRDIVIAGAGPAGCMAAIGALQRDPSCSVVLIDPAVKERHRVGEALLTGTVSTLDEAGILERVRSEGFLRKIGAAYRWGPHPAPWHVDYRASDAEDYPSSMIEGEQRFSFHVPRHRFDQLLREIAVEHGAELIESRVQFHTGEGTPSPVLSATARGGDRFRARYWIDATGQASALGRAAERVRIAHPKAVRYGYTRSVDWNRARALGYHPQRTNIVATRGGWFWVIHLGEAGRDLTSLGFVSDNATLRGMTPEDAVARFPALQDFGLDRFELLSEHGQPALGWYTCGDFSYRGHYLAGPNWAQVGDAALFVDPILSTGVTLAAHYGLLRGRAAAEMVAGGDDRQGDISRHQLREGLMISEVCQQWYGAERCPAHWRQQTREWAAGEFDYQVGDDSTAFRWLTNLEFLQSQYHPFPKHQREAIERQFAVHTDLSA